MKAGTELATDPRLLEIKNIIINKGGFKRGHFVLASGHESDVYINGKTVTLDPRGISLVAEAFYDKVKDLGIASIGGLESGSIPIATAIAQYSFRMRNPIPAFWVRDEKKDHGDMTTFEGVLNPGTKVVVVDDVATAGNSIQKAITEVRRQNCTIERIIVLIDREEGARARFQSEGYRYESLLKKSDFI
jgi:orotate phosphoribosyltransferase